MKSGSSDNAQQKATQDDNIRAQIRAMHPSMSEEDVDRRSRVAHCCVLVM
jgi:hypothetical protein